MTLLLNLPFKISFAIVQFSVILSLYSINHYMEFKQDLKTYPLRTSFIKDKIGIFVMATIIFYLLALVLSLLQNIGSVLTIILFTFLMVVYGLHIGNFRLKDILFVKNIYVGIVWTLLLVLFPQIFFQSTISSKTIYYIIIMGLITAISTIVYDLRDFKGDKKNNVKTIPTILGLENTKKFLNIVTVIVLIFSVMLYIYQGKEYLAFILTSLYMLLVISRIGLDNIRVVTEIYDDAFFAFFGFSSVLLHGV